jgi:hypothetical protein
METMTITLQLPDGLKVWLTTEGAPLFRSATQQAAYLCSEYLKRTYKTSTSVPRSGTDARFDTMVSAHSATTRG